MLILMDFFIRSIAAMSAYRSVILVVFGGLNMTKSRHPLLTLMVAVVLATYVSYAAAQEAPFGLHWGDRLESLPKPTELFRVKNIALLIYKRENLPESFVDIEEIALKVCDAEGLQQAESNSHLLSREDARRNFQSAYEEGVRRYGKADEGDPANGTASWNTARVTMIAKLDDLNFYRISMVHDGPRFTACAQTYDSQDVSPNGQEN